MPIWLCGFAAGAWALPGDTLVSIPGIDSSRLFLSGERDLGRSMLRHRIDLVGERGGWNLVLRDTSLLRLSHEPGIWSGETFLQTGLFRRPDSGIGVSWKLWNRTNGLGASDPSLAEDAWRQNGWLRYALGDSVRGVAASAGWIAEKADPGSTSQGISKEALPSDALHATGLWGIEGSWSGFASAPTTIQASWTDHVGGTTLKQARTSIDASVIASIAGEGRDTLRAGFWHDSTRTRSIHFLSDRSEVRRGADAAWRLPAGDQELGVWASWERVASRDLSDRVPDLERTGSNLGVEFGGSLPRGFSHRHLLYRRDEERIWNSTISGDPLDAELRSAQDRRDRDKTGEFGLADTLAWKTSRWGGLRLELGLAQSLRSIRHPQNGEPAEADRPDEDLSRRQLGIGVRSDLLAWGERPLFSWTVLSQRDVFPRAVHSIQTTDRIENKLGASVSIPVADHVRPQMYAWAREMRDTWRFQEGREDGLLEYGLRAGGELGPVDAPWLAAHWARWRIKTGPVEGSDFAPDRIQDVWQPEVRGFLRGGPWSLEPWLRHQIEREDSWNGSGWSSGRYSARRIGADLARVASRMELRASVARVWLEPGDDDWVGSLSAKGAW